MMKKGVNRGAEVLGILALLIFVPWGGLWAQSGVVKEFTATAQGSGVVLEWISGQERGVLQYAVERSFDGENFLAIGTIDPKGDGTRYHYQDNNLFKNELRLIYYRIRVDFQERRSEWSEVERVTLSFSSVRRTWGSIKAMFR
ncbi:MAG: hypothetical protein ACK4OO_04660 [bacterium]